MKFKFTQESVYRMFRTFFQAFMATFITDLGYISFTDDINWKYIACSVIIPAISAGLSALMNMEVQDNDGLQ